MQIQVFAETLTCKSSGRNASMAIRRISLNNVQELHFVQSG